MDPPFTLKPAEVAVDLIQEAVTRHNTRYEQTFCKAVLAGVMLSFGGLFDFIITGGSPSLAASDPGIVKVLGGFVFPVGLVMIVLQGFDLLTSNIMVPSRFFPMAVLNGALPWWSIPVNWIIVTFGNLAGNDGLVVDDPYATYIRNFAVTKAVTPAWYQILLRGIGCNWLVCIAVWQATGARDTISKIIAIWFPIWVFVACGFDHGIHRKKSALAQLTAFCSGREHVLIATRNYASCRFDGSLLHQKVGIMTIMLLPLFTLLQGP
ncbi:Formate/nitrite transporter-domain-containing protein [Pisolithus marmoratus]|nr:Formate/nitrite transporter-domain-containing protein [Pisolithus marmoratus]